MSQLWIKIWSVSFFLQSYKVQTEFEDLYQKVRPHLDNNERIEFKSRLINLYSKYKSSFFYKRSHQDLGLSHEERVVLENLSKDKTIIICKPDKGNGVVVMNRDDYVRKMNKICKIQLNLKKLRMTIT